MKKELSKQTPVLHESLPNTITISWSIEDVLGQAKEAGIYLSRDDAREILNNVRENYEPEFGITWATISATINDHGPTKPKITHETMMEIVSRISDIILHARYINIDLDVEDEDEVHYTEEGQRLFNELYDTTEDIMLSIISDKGDGDGGDKLPAMICEKIAEKTTNRAVEKGRVEEFLFLYTKQINLPDYIDSIMEGTFDNKSKEYRYFDKLNGMEWRKCLETMEDRGLFVEFIPSEDVFIVSSEM